MHSLLRGRSRPHVCQRSCSGRLRRSSEPGWGQKNLNVFMSTINKAVIYGPDLPVNTWESNGWHNHDNTNALDWYLKYIYHCFSNVIDLWTKQQFLRPHFSGEIPLAERKESQGGEQDVYSANQRHRYSLIWGRYHSCPSLFQCPSLHSSINVHKTTGKIHLTLTLAKKWHTLSHPPPPPLVKSTITIIITITICYFTTTQFHSLKGSYITTCTTPNANSITRNH